MKLTALFAISLLVGCGGGSSKHRFATDDGDDTTPPTPGIPEVTITQGFGVNDATGGVLSVVINYSLFDPDAGDLVNVLVEYAIRTCTDIDFRPFAVAPAGIGSEGITDLTTANVRPGQVHTFVIDAIAAGISGVGPVDLLIRITPSNNDATGVAVTSDVVHVGALSVTVQLSSTQPSVAPSFANQMPVSLLRNGLAVDQITLVAAFTPGSISLSSVPIVLGPAASSAGASISGIILTPGRIEASIGGGGDLSDGVIAFLQFDIAATATGGAFPVLCISDVPTGTGTRGSRMGVRQCVDCAERDGSVLLAGPAPGIDIGDSAQLAVPSSNNCIPVNLTTNGVIMDLITVTVAYDPVQVAPAAIPVVDGAQGIAASAVIGGVDISVPGRISFSVGGGGTLSDGVIANVCFDVLLAASLGIVPIPCVAAGASSMGTPSTILCSSGGSLVLATFAAVLNIGSYTVPVGIDPMTMCSIHNLGTVGDPTAVAPANSNTIDLTLSTQGTLYNQIQATVLFDSRLLTCATNPLVSANGGLSIGPAAPMGSTFTMASCNVTGIGFGMGAVRFTILTPVGAFSDGVLARLTFDVPAPSPDAAAQPLDAATPVFASVTCSTVAGIFGPSAPAISCGANGTVMVRAPCVTRQCTGLRVFSGVDSAMDDFTLPILDAANGPIEYDADRWGSPVILTGLGDGVFSSPDDRGDQQLQVYAMFNEAPLIERVTPSSGGTMSGGSTTYMFLGLGGGVAVSAQGLISANDANCCDTLRITYTGNGITATPTVCTLDIAVCMDASGPDDVNPVDPVNKRNGPMPLGDIDGTIPGMPSGLDVATIPGGMGSTFVYDLFVNSGVNRLGAYQLTIGFDGSVLAVDPAAVTVNRSSMMDPLFSVVSQGVPASTVTINDVAASGSNEVGVFNLIGIDFMVLSAGVTPLTVTIDNLTSVAPGPDMAFGTADDVLANLGAPGPRTAFGGSTSGCPVQFP